MTTKSIIKMARTNKKTGSVRIALTFVFECEEERKDAFDAAIRAVRGAFTRNEKLEAFVTRLLRDKDRVFG